MLYEVITSVVIKSYGQDPQEFRGLEIVDHLAHEDGSIRSRLEKRLGPEFQNMILSYNFV